MSEYFNSNDKFRRRHTQSEKKIAQNVQSMDCVKLSMSEKNLKNREKSQPVKITELLGYSENTKHCPRESVRKRLPERLNHDLKNINSNQGKQEYITNKSTRLTINARRKLDLNISPKQHIQSVSKITAPIYDGKEENTAVNNLQYSVYNINSGKKNISDNVNEPCGTENKRKSFLLPPNSIKNRYLVTENEKEQLKLKNKSKSKDVQHRHFRLCTELKSTELNENVLTSKLMKDNTEPSEVNESNISGCNEIQDPLNLEINQEIEKGSLDNFQEGKESFPKGSPVQENMVLNRPSVIVKSHVTTKMNIPSKLHSIIEARESDNPLLPKRNLHTKNGSLESKLTKNRLAPSNTRENFQEEVHGVESNHSPNENVKNLCIDEKDIIYMKSNLEGLICETEEKLFNLKEMLKHVNKMLSSNNNNEHKETSQKHMDYIENSHCILEKEEQNMASEEQESSKDNCNNEIEKVLIEKCVQSIANEENMLIKEKEIVQNDEYALVPKALPQLSTVDESLDLTIGNEEKENVNIISVLNSKDVMQNQDKSRYSNTPSQIQSMYNKDDSFLNLEDQLNIIHVKGLSNTSCLVITPVKRNTKWHEKPLQEYMMLKSSISFLQTPDAKRFKPKVTQNDDNAVSNTLKSCISHKVLTELRDLCTDSPL